MADDREQRVFEIVKLRIAFLQHITTLSGAAIVIVLALINRPETAEITSKLTFAALMFGIAALISVSGLWWLLVLGCMDNPVRETHGKIAVSGAGAGFGAAVLSTLLLVLGTPNWFLALLSIAFGAVALATTVWTLIALRK